MAASLAKAVLQLSRLSLDPSTCRTLTTQCGPLAFRATLPVAAEPLKKRRKMDVNIVMQREQKKRRRLEKAIRRLQSKGLKLKPVEEIEGDRQVIKTLDIRARTPEILSYDESEERALLNKQWSHYKRMQLATEMGHIQRAVQSQQMALHELRAESEDLYQEAIQTDPTLVPLDLSGPVNTPPIAGYEAPDGEYIDTTRDFSK